MLQLLCAIYVTIVFDSILFRRFWTPDYYNVLETHINSYNLPIGRILQSLTSKIQGKNVVLVDNIRKRGSIFLCNTLFIMCSIAIFDNIDNELSAIFGIFFLISYLIYVCSFFFTIRWRFLIPILCVEYLLFIPIHAFSNMSIDINGYVYKVRCAIILLTLFPICIQIVQSWLYSTAIHSFVASELQTVAADYRKAKDALQQKDPNIIPEKYKNAFLNFVFSNEKEDIKLTPINQCLIDELTTVFENITIFQLINAYIHNPKTIIRITGEPLSDESESVISVNKNNNIKTTLVISGTTTPKVINNNSEASTIKVSAQNNQKFSNRNSIRKKKKP